MLKKSNKKKNIEKRNNNLIKIGAAIIGLIGFLLLIFNLKITGAVIGGDSSITMGIIGVFMVFFALMLYSRPLKKSFKK